FLSPGGKNQESSARLSSKNGTAWSNVVFHHGVHLSSLVPQEDDHPDPPGARSSERAPEAPRRGAPPKDSGPPRRGTHQEEVPGSRVNAGPRPSSSAAPAIYPSAFYERLLVVAPRGDTASIATEIAALRGEGPGGIEVTLLDPKGTPVGPPPGAK